ncbi:MAG: hypothetical protein H6659_02095 [Ardenticatenaceae bacterium]|nr:hypothetical protein [Ardenticatenaceae bacterium]
MKAEIVSIGTQLLLGDVLDTNTAYISRSLQELGIEIIYKVTVGDDLEHLTDALRIALGRADVVLATGGIKFGPPNYTRQAVAAATGLWLDPETRRLAGSRILGRAEAGETGFILEGLPGLLICLPGDRREMAYLLETEVLPYLQEHANLKSELFILRTVGIMESSLRQQLADLTLKPNQQIGFDSFAGQTNLRLRVAASSDEEIQAQIADLRAQIIARLGDHVFGQNQDRLEAIILQMLKRGSYRLAIAECYTDLALSQLLIPDNETEPVVSLPVTTENELAQMLALAPPGADETITRWCRTAAQTLMQRTAVHLGLLIYNNLMPGGVQLSVYLATAQGISVTQRSFGGHPGNINQWACSLGLAHLYRWLLVHPILQAET